MNDLSSLFPENLYHSYVVEGDYNTAGVALRSFLEKRGDIEPHSPDILFQVYDSFTVADSMEIKEWHSQRGITAGKKVCIIGAKFINHDAEQTLLKMIEEPSEDTYFFIIVPNALSLPDTILSRSHIVRIHGSESAQAYSANDFYKSTPKDRIEIVSGIIEDFKNSEGSGALRFASTELINGLEKIVYEEFKKDKTNTETQFILGELYKARDYLSTPGASVKMILEHISLVL